MNFVKKLVGSKIVVFNLITTAAAIFALPEVIEVSPTTAMVMSNAITIVLRLFFSTPTPPATPPAA